MATTTVKCPQCEGEIDIKKVLSPYFYCPNCEAPLLHEGLCNGKYVVVCRECHQAFTPTQVCNNDGICPKCQMQPLALKLVAIAAWNSEIGKNTVSIPALQRGLVWKPKQIELLWDSLMRGIPIGSFVICKAIINQKKSEYDQAEYHLLDGQQRVNAIQLGFDNFFSHKKILNPKKSILWLDLDPGNLPKDSSRNFLFRVTTTAHPWGYTRGDNEGTLGAGTVRQWISENLGMSTAASNYTRPSPEEMQPIEAKFPIPVSLLINAFENENKAINKEKLKKYVSSCNGTWVQKIVEKLNDSKFDFLNISKGFATALNTTVLAIQAPEELLTSSRQETNNVEREDITNIEHLFQRLNQQGTRLDGEELIYSLIKAYWPEICSRIDPISENRMPCSKMTTLAFRVVLTEVVHEKKKLASNQSVSTIRRLAKDDSKNNVRLAILNFINSTGDSSLESCCSRIDKWLGTKPKTSWGLPPVLRSSIAYNNPELFLLLLLLAKNNITALDEECCRMLTGIVTYVAWFGQDHSACTEILYSKLHEPITTSNMQDALRSANRFLYPLHTPKDTIEFISIPQKNLPTWNWWYLIADKDEAIQRERQDKWWEFLNRIRSSKAFILYAQREFLTERFSEYDPARKDLWEAHNRPWDYDHILPNAFTFNKKTNNEYMNFCKQWCNTIGNFRAWPFEDNRSDQAEKAGLKIYDIDLLKKSFVSESEMSGFDQDQKILSNAEAASKFAEACKSRIIRMYEEWYKQLRLNNYVENDSGSETK